MSESCQSCRFYAMKDGKFISGKEYECHRYPPFNEGQFRYPIPNPDEWCGEYRQGEHP
jgi:hypothetical protein